MHDRKDYQHQYYLARKAADARMTVIATRGYLPPRVKSTYRIRKRHVFSGVVFRMANFSGDPNLRINQRRR